MARQSVPFERQVRAALTHLHDLPYLQTHALGEIRGKALHAALIQAIDGLRSDADRSSGRAQRLLELRYVEALGSERVAATLGISMGEYYREHTQALAAVSSLLDERGAHRPVESPSREKGHSLPRRIDRFVGREDEVTRLRHLLATTPLVTLVGAGGVGKTRLALEVASDVTPRDRDGLWFVELAGLRDGALVPAALTAALDMPSSADAIAGLIQRLEGRMALIVLDNCEHLVDAVGALVGAVLGACSALRILATSREPLGVAGETVWPVAPLTAEAGARLFVERARAARPSFVLSRAHEDAVSRICARLDGIPLAIELAAARMRALSPAEVADRLDDALGLLTGGGRGAPARHQTLRAALDWSHNLLDDGSRGLLRRLAVFAGSFDLEAAEQVAGSTVDGLSRVVDRSLLVADTENPLGTRYRLLEPIRQYAAEGLEAFGERDDLSRRHFAHYLDLTDRIEPELWGPGERAGLQRLEAEHDNLRSALDWSVRSDPDQSLRLAGNLYRFWRLSGHQFEGRRWLEASLAASRPDAPARAFALATAATLARDLLDWPSVRAQSEEALALAEPLGDHRAAALALGNLAGYERTVGGGDGEAEGRGLLVHSRAGDFGWGIAAGLNSLAFGARRRGDQDTARRMHEEGLAEARRIGNPESIFFSLGYLASHAYEEGDLDAAERWIGEADESSADAYPGFPWYWILRGQVQLERGDLAAAEATFRDSMSPARRNREWRFRPPLGVYWLGVIQTRRGDSDRGLRLMASAMDSVEKARVFVGFAGGLRAYGTLDDVKGLAPPDRLAALWAEGRSMSPEEATVEALA